MTTFNITIKCDGESDTTTFKDFIAANEEFDDFADEIENCLRAGEVWYFGGGASPFVEVVAA